MSAHFNISWSLYDFCFLFSEQTLSPILIRLLPLPLALPSSSFSIKSRPFSRRHIYLMMLYSDYIRQCENTSNEKDSKSLVRFNVESVFREEHTFTHVYSHSPGYSLCRRCSWRMTREKCTDNGFQPLNSIFFRMCSVVVRFDVLHSEVLYNNTFSLRDQHFRLLHSETFRMNEFFPSTWMKSGWNS